MVFHLHIARLGLLTLLAGVSGSSEAPALVPLTKEAAVKLAERFVLENGYTDAPKTVLKKKLDPERFEYFSSTQEWLGLRFNSLRPAAIGVRAGRGDTVDPPGWNVAFDYVRQDPKEAKHVRVVTMAPDGSQMIMLHQDLYRDHFAGVDRD